MKEINSDNYPQAVAALRDILYMYYDLITSYDGFGHNIETGTFDSFFYIDSYLNEPIGWTFGIDIDLIHKGSAVALLCKLSDYWDDYEEAPSGEFAENIKELLREGRIGHLPIAEEAIRIGLADEEEYRGKLRQVYQEYVVEFFKNLIGTDAV